MASATKRGRRWMGRYYGPDGVEYTKTFNTKGEAKAWAEGQEARKRSGDWTDPRRAKVTIKEWAPTWLETRSSLKPKTLQGYDSLLKTVILPRWGDTRLDQVSTAEVRGWLATMEGPRRKKLSASRARQAYNILSGMLALAVEDGRLPRNPAKPNGSTRGMLPKLPKTRHHIYLTHIQVGKLADAAGDYRPLILLLAYCGLRWGEAAALRVFDVDLLNGRLSVRQAVSDIGGKLVYDTPKNHASRTVPLPKFLRAEMEPLLMDKSPESLLVTSPEGDPLRLNNFRPRVFDPAVKRAGIHKLKPHDLRHTAASLAVASGANVKAVQRMLGHSSAAMTLDVYADLFDSDLETIADRLDEAFSDARADYLRTEREHGPVQLPLRERQKGL